jgi:hypothetical protein
MGFAEELSRSGRNYDTCGRRRLAWCSSISASSPCRIGRKATSSGLNCASLFDRNEATFEANTRLAESGKLRMRALVVYGDVVSFAAKFAAIGGVRAH